MDKGDIASGGMFVEPHQIRYAEIDPPLRKLIRLINAESWIRTYGCCAGRAHHDDTSATERQFYIGLFVDGDSAGSKRLGSWLDEANRLNGPTGLSAGLERVYKHPFGQGSVDGWYAYQLAVHEVPGRQIPLQPQAYMRMIKCLELAWKELQLDAL